MPKFTLIRWIKFYVILLSIYSFGTFGITNLVGIREFAQTIIIVCGLFVFLFIYHPKLNSLNLIEGVIFFSILQVSVIFFVSDANVSESLVMALIFYLVMTENIIFIIKLSKAIVAVTVIICLLVLISYIYYLAYPENFTNANFDIYDSSTGPKAIHASFILDWISFTSGDGFEFLGFTSPRMKGYSNEPSATIVHYLSPVALSFLIGGGYKKLGIFILTVNIICIGSFVAHIIIGLSFIIYCLSRLFKKYVKKILLLGVISLILALYNYSILYSIFEFFGDFLVRNLGFDLVSRKLDSNLGERQFSISSGLENIAESPFGFASTTLGSGSGLLYVVGALTGWVGLIIFCKYMYKIFVNGSFALKNATTTVCYGAAFSLATLMVLTLISGYGWNRIPGLIILSILYKYLQFFDIKNTIASDSIR